MREIAGADQIGTLIDDGAATLDFSVLEQQQRLSSLIAAQEPLQRLDRCLFAEAADRTTLREATLQVDADVVRNDPHLMRMGVGA